MTLRYVDHDARPITRETWRERFLDPAWNKPLFSEQGDGWEVRACWLGVYSSDPMFNDAGNAFLVECLDVEEKRGDTPATRGQVSIQRREMEGHAPRGCKTADEARSIAGGLAMIFRAKHKK